MSCVTGSRPACAVARSSSQHHHTQWLLGDCSLFPLELGHSLSGLCLYDHLASVTSQFPFLVSRKLLGWAKKQWVGRGSDREQVALWCSQPEPGQLSPEL